MPSDYLHLPIDVGQRSDANQESAAEKSIK
ncbi:hypothetical protein PEC301645_27420 [Pectobacterium carotovorum subsp. carotovorum]|nr:hypothetical protein PEC301645_27420 [Pectobacterium carotovorum subsp. carotovorum]